MGASVSLPRPFSVAVIGGGPAGLMAAEILAGAGADVTVYERKPSPARKFLMAGRGGLNLTHSEDLSVFLTRYGAAMPVLADAIRAFPPAALRTWCEGLGQPTFVGTSGRVFPESFKASPLLRAWIARLEGLGVRLRMSCDWQGWDEGGRLRFTGPDGTEEYVRPEATLLALGGASWPKLGADGSWAEELSRKGIAVESLRPANSGFAVGWSEKFQNRFAGQPLKSITLSGAGRTVKGEAMINRYGLEGGAVYALSAVLREEIALKGKAILTLDLKPGLDEKTLAKRLAAPRGRNSFSNHLRKTAGLPPVAAGLLRESVERDDPATWPPEKLAEKIKALPLILTAPFSLERAISSAGGIALAELDGNFMLRALPGVFAAGEMLDWEAPTGGYLLQATFATAVRAAEGMLSWLAEKTPE